MSGHLQSLLSFGILVTYTTKKNPPEIIPEIRINKEQNNILRFRQISAKGLKRQVMKVYFRINSISSNHVRPTEPTTKCYTQHINIVSWYSHSWGDTETCGLLQKQINHCIICISPNNNYDNADADLFNFCRCEQIQFNECNSMVILVVLFVCGLLTSLCAILFFRMFLWPFCGHFWLLSISFFCSIVAVWCFIVVILHLSVALFEIWQFSKSSAFSATVHFIPFFPFIYFSQRNKACHTCFCSSAVVFVSLRLFHVSMWSNSISW